MGHLSLAEQGLNAGGGVRDCLRYLISSFIFGQLEGILRFVMLK